MGTGPRDISSKQNSPLLRLVEKYNQWNASNCSGLYFIWTPIPLTIKPTTFVDNSYLNTFVRDSDQLIYDLLKEWLQRVSISSWNGHSTDFHFLQFFNTHSRKSSIASQHFYRSSQWFYMSLRYCGFSTMQWHHSPSIFSTNPNNFLPIILGILSLLRSKSFCYTKCCRVVELFWHSSAGYCAITCNPRIKFSCWGKRFERQGLLRTIKSILIVPKLPQPTTACVWREAAVMYFYKNLYRTVLVEILKKLIVKCNKKIFYCPSI